MKRNLLFLVSDEHRRDAAGCYGSPLVQTPNLDRLAAGGVRFDRAYTPSPICVPARAALATGRHPHQTGFWSNCQPYDGSVPTWAHHLRDAGYATASVGKLHFRAAADDNGFDDEILPLHVRDGVGWLRGLLRREDMVWDKVGEFAAQVGPGECEYTRYDRAVRDAAIRWLHREAPAVGPWALFVSFATPHYPLVVPEQYFRLYPLDRMGTGARQAPPPHPVPDGVRRFMDYDAHFDERGRRVARAAYFGMCTFLDALIGDVLRSLENAGQADRTTVVYTSDHGELLGEHGMWTKCVMYESAVAVPLLMAGAGVPAGSVVSSPASLVDCFPTALELAGCAPGADLPGRSLLGQARRPERGRVVFSEYHDGGACTGMFMVRSGRWKYVHYPGFEPELYDLEADPAETRDLAASPAHAEIGRARERELRAIVDPEAASARAFADQDALIRRVGGRDAILATDDYDFSPTPVGGGAGTGVRPRGV